MYKDIKKLCYAETITINYQIRSSKKMDSCRHRGRSQFSEKSLALLSTTSKTPIIIPAESHSATMVKMDAVAIHKIRKSSSLVHKRYRNSLESSRQSYRTALLMSNKNVYKFEVDHLNVQNCSNPIENNSSSGPYAQELTIKRRQVRCFLGQGTRINA